MAAPHGILRKATAIFGVRIATVLSSLVVLIYFSHHYSEALFGSFQTFWIHTSVLSIVAGLGLSSLCYTYKSEKLLYLFAKVTPAHWLKYSVFLIVVASVFVILQLQWNNLFSQTIYSVIALFLYFIVLTLSVLLEALTVIFGNYLFLLVASFGSALGLLLSYYLYVFCGITAEILVVLLLFFLLFKVILYTIALRQAARQLVPEEFDVRSVQRLWWNLGFYDVTQTVFKFLDKFVLTFFITKELLSVYTNATYEIPIFAIVYGTLRSTSSIYFAHHHVSYQQDAAYMKKVGELMGIFTFAAVAFFFAFDDEYMDVVFSEKYIVGIPIFLIAIMKIPAMNFTFTAYLQFHEKGAIINKGAILDIIFSLLLVYPLYQLLGLKGISLAIVISTYFQVLYYAYFAKQIMQVSWWDILPIRHWLVQVFAFTGLAFGLSYGVQLLDLSAFWTLLIGLILLSVVAMFWIVMVYNKSKILLNNS